MRSAEVCSIWKQVFGRQSERVHCVLGAQSANTYTARQALDCPLWSEAPCSGHGIDAIAIAPYFGDHIGATSAQNEVMEWTGQADGGLGAIFTELTEGGVLSNSPGVGAIAAVTAQVAAYRALSNERGLGLIAYEGGQHVADIFGVDAAIEALFTEANRDARMGQLYDDYFSMWQREGGALFVNYTAIERPGRFGAWGVLEHLGQETSPKYDALMRAIGAAAP